MADAPAAPPPPPSLAPATSTGANGLVSLGLMRDLRKSVRLKSWSAKTTDGSEKRGWLHKKLLGKSKFISCWFEMDEPNEVPFFCLIFIIQFPFILKRKKIEKGMAKGTKRGDFILAKS